LGGHLTLDTESNIRLKRLGEPGVDIHYPRENLNFAGDCVYATQRHFVDCLLTGAEFESNGDDYLKTLAVVDAIYESAATRQCVAVKPVEESR
jgi:predicted dehydrogenase